MCPQFDSGSRHHRIDWAKSAAETMDIRIGTGYDIHRTSFERKLVLCGVHIPCEFGLDGHSDADVAIHALSDAILGALALPDIGTKFPDDQQFTKDMDSKNILLFAKNEALKAGYRISNVDLVIIAEAPKLCIFFEKMRKNLSKTLNISADRIGIKAKTHEKIGEIGSLQAIATLANVLLQKYL